MSRRQLLEERRQKLNEYASKIRFRLLLLRQRDRLQALQQQAKSEYEMTSATVNRHRLLRKRQDRISVRMEHAHHVMLMQKLRKFLELRRAFSENFADVLRDGEVDRIGSLEGRPWIQTGYEQDDSEEDQEDDDRDEDEARPTRSSKGYSSGDSDVTRHELNSQLTATMSGLHVMDETTGESDYESAGDNSHPQYIEASSASSSSSPQQIEMSSSPVKGQLPSSRPYRQQQHQSPSVALPSPMSSSSSPVIAPATSSRKKKDAGLMLDKESVSTGRKAPKHSLEQTIRKSKSLSSLFLAEADDHTYMELLNLLPPITRFTLRELELDEILSNAQLRHDLVFDPDLQFKPNVDATIVDDAGSATPSSRPSKSDIYWTEVGNEIDQGYTYRIPLLLAEVRAIMVELLPNGQEIKEEIFANIDVNLISQQMEHGVMDPHGLVNYLAKLMKINCAPIRDELVDSMVSACEDGDIVQTLRICFDILELMKLANRYAEHAVVPETLKMDTSRLIAFYNDWQDITILASLLVLFRQAAGAKCATSHLEEAKKNLWVLLNDSETTMSHISLQVAHTAGQIRGKPFADQEREMLGNMMEKTLAPESKLYDLIQKRVGENLRHVIVTGTNAGAGKAASADRGMLSKHGLSQLEKEIVELGQRIIKVTELNRAIFGKVYAALLDDIRAGETGLLSPNTTAVMRDQSDK
eukprot:jgi/Hompol1/1048/HPOL_001804-RA